MDPTIILGALAIIVSVVIGAWQIYLAHKQMKVKRDGKTKENSPRSEGVPILTRQMVGVSELAKSDCQMLQIEPVEVVSFVVNEGQRHAKLFGANFSSLPLVFRQNVILLSWDSACVIIERVLSREKVYPLNDTWSTTLSIYRRAYVLPYRSGGPDKLLSSAEARRSLLVYKQLVESANSFIKLLKEKEQLLSHEFDNIDALFDEAEFAYNSDDIKVCIGTMEALLSTVHKLILQYAPQGQVMTRSSETSKPRIENLDESKISILLVDDEREILASLEPILQTWGYSVTSVPSALEAFKAMVEFEFDIVITDLRMPDTDGREVLIAAKKSSKKTKVLMLTAYGELARIAELLRIGLDGFVRKPCEFEELRSELNQLTQRDRQP